MPLVALVTREARGPNEKGCCMVIVVVLATLLLSLTVVLFGGTILTCLQAACSQPLRIEEIRRLRQEGLAVNQEGEGE